jgi:F-type H+-transporting ATPase subunit a
MLYGAFEQFAVVRPAVTVSLFASLGFVSFVMAFSSARLVPSPLAVIVRALASGILALVYGSLGTGGRDMLPLVSRLVVMILVANLLGMVPYSAALTSQFFVGLTLSFGIGFGRLLLGFLGMRLRFFELLLPYGSPIAMWPFFVLIETLSLVIPGLSLGLRLGVNILAGHVLLAVLFGFSWALVLSGGLLSLVGAVMLCFLPLLVVMELAIGCIQAYVFGLLSCVYIGEMLVH